MGHSGHRSSEQDPHEHQARSEGRCHQKGPAKKVRVRLLACPPRQDGVIERAERCQAQKIMTANKPSKHLTRKKMVARSQGRVLAPMVGSFESLQKGRQLSRGPAGSPANRGAMPHADFSKWVRPADLASLAVWFGKRRRKRCNWRRPSDLRRCLILSEHSILAQQFVENNPRRRCDIQGVLSPEHWNADMCVGDL